MLFLSTEEKSSLKQDVSISKTIEKIYYKSKARIKVAKNRVQSLSNNLTSKIFKKDGKPSYKNRKFNTKTSLPTGATPRHGDFEKRKVLIDAEKLKNKYPLFLKINGLSANTGKIELTRDSKIPKDTELSVLIDSQCLENTGNTELLSAIAKSQNQTPGYELQFHSYKYKLEEVTEFGDLLDKAERDRCLVGMALEERAYKVAAPNDEFFNEQRHHTNSLNTAVAFDTIQDPVLGATMTEVVAVVDTGVAINHEDLVDNLFVTQDNTFGFDFVNNDDNPNDDEGHGTNVAGLAAARTNNAIGVAGTMPDNLQILGVKVLDGGGGGSITDIANGIRYAAENGASFINLSLGGPGRNSFVEAAVEFAVSQGSTVFIAAGNSSVNLDSQSFFPASFGSQLQGAITVGSIDAVTQNLSSFSNLSSTRVEVAAPGSNRVCATALNNNYTCLEGTSMATPIALGVGAVARSILRRAGLQTTPQMIENIIKDHAITEQSLSNSILNGKRVNLQSMVTYLQETFPETGAQITIVQQPANVTVTAGEPATFTVVAEGDGLTYQWRKDNQNINGATQSTFTIAATNAQDSGVYSVEITDEDDIVIQSGNAVLDVQFAPMIATQPQSQNIVIGNDITLQVAAAGNPNQLTYQWTKDNVAINGATQASFTINNAQAGDAGIYRVEITNIIDTTISDPATVDIFTPPEIQTQPISQAIVEGEILSLSVAATGNPNVLSYQWRRNNVNINGATQAVLTVNAISRDLEGNYSVVITNDGGSITSDAAAIDVQFLPEFIEEPSGLQTTLGSSVSLSGSANADPAPTYQWYKIIQGQATVLAGQTQPQLDLTNLQWADRGTYQLGASNAVGQTLSTPVEVSMEGVSRGPASESSSSSTPLGPILLDRTSGIDEIDSSEENL